MRARAAAHHSPDPIQKSADTARTNRSQATPAVGDKHNPGGRNPAACNAAQTFGRWSCGMSDSNGVEGDTSRRGRPSEAQRTVRYRQNMRTMGLYASAMTCLLLCERQLDAFRLRFRGEFQRSRVAR